MGDRQPGRAGADDAQIRLELGAGPVGCQVVDHDRQRALRAARAVNRVTLRGTEVTTSALGYGCSQLMARLGRAESTRLLEAAFDAGISHFDTARSYGYGEAESALGDFIRGRREQVTVAT